MAKQKDEFREKFRPSVDSALDREIDEALGDMAIEDLYGFDKPETAPQPAAADTGGAGRKGVRRGKIISIGKDDVFVDFGGKSQGVVSALQVLVDEPPQVGQEMDFHVERYDAREGLLVLSRKGATATNVSWETLEVGQIVEGTVTGTNKGG